MSKSDDLISRQAVIDALTKTSGIRGDALKALYDLPPVNPRPKTGHWINGDCKSLASTLRYPAHREIQELLCDILELLQTGK